MSSSPAKHLTPCCENPADVAEHPIEEEGAEEGELQPERQRALQLGLVQNPQDGSADTAISVALSSSYITYSAATLERLQCFFRTEEASTTCLTLRHVVLMMSSVCRSADPTLPQSVFQRVRVVLMVTSVPILHLCLMVAAGCGPVYCGGASGGASGKGSRGGQEAGPRGAVLQAQAAAACDAGCPQGRCANSSGAKWL